MNTLYRRVTDPLTRTSDVLLLVVRAALGLLFIDHGRQKFQAKGGLGSFEYFLRSLKNIPAPGLTSHVVPAVEVVGGILLLMGLLSRVIALALAAEMVVTGFVVKLHDLHTGWVAATGAGAEVDVVFLLLLAVVVLLGPGRVSLDAALGLERRSQAAAAIPSMATIG